MVIKTDACFYTEYKIYPGHGARVVRKDGRLLAFINQKARSLFFQKIKAQRLTWTQQWRRRHKKGRVEAVQKRKKKAGAKVYKAIAGLDIDALKKRRTQKADFRKADREARLRKIKEKKRSDKDSAKKASGVKPKKQGFEKVPKQRKQMMGAVKR